MCKKLIIKFAFRSAKRAVSLRRLLVSKRMIIIIPMYEAPPPQLRIRTTFVSECLRDHYGAAAAVQTNSRCAHRPLQNPPADLESLVQ